MKHTFKILVPFALLATSLNAFAEPDAGVALDETPDGGGKSQIVSVPLASVQEIKVRPTYLKATMPTVLKKVFTPLSSAELTPDYKTLSENQGLYKISGPIKPGTCSFMDSDFKIDDTFSIALMKARSKTEFDDAGDVTLFMSKFYKNWAVDGDTSKNPKRGMWYRTFDRNDFIRVNQPEDSVTMKMPAHDSDNSPTVPLTISQTAKFDPKTSTLTHTIAMSTSVKGVSQGKETSVQTIHFDKPGQSFTYSYVITDQDGAGKVTNTMNVCDLSFKKVSQ